MQDKMKDFNYGIHIERGLIDYQEVIELKSAFFEALEYCKKIRIQTGVEEYMSNTVHHVLFMNTIYQKVLEKRKNIETISNFFNGKKFILNSIGGQNNVGINYATNIHRDVRFYTQEKMLLNTIWCLSPINKNTGATEFMLNSHLNEELPSENEFNLHKVVLNAEPGDVVYFDSRIWHRAGAPVLGVDERIIFTPIMSRPFIKPGFDYAAECRKYGDEKVSELIKQLSSFYSDVPKNHFEWYNWKNKRFYHKDQDL